MKSNILKQLYFATACNEASPLPKNNLHTHAMVEITNS